MYSIHTNSEYCYFLKFRDIKITRHGLFLPKEICKVALKPEGRNKNGPKIQNLFSKSFHMIGQMEQVGPLLKKVNFVHI